MLIPSPLCHIHFKSRTWTTTLYYGCPSTDPSLVSTPHPLRFCLTFDLNSTSGVFTWSWVFVRGNGSSKVESTTLKRRPYRPRGNSPSIGVRPGPQSLLRRPRPTQPPDRRGERSVLRFSSRGRPYSTLSLSRNTTWLEESWSSSIDPKMKTKK